MKISSLEAAISIRNILFPTDFSRESMSALPYALAMARKYASKMYPVHISPEPPGAPSSVREAIGALGVHPRDETEQGISQLQAQLPPIPFEMVFKRGDIWTELSKIINAKQIDLIVTGTHGRSGIGKLLAGSVAERIFRHATCPVLTVGPSVSGEPESIVDLHEILFATDFSKSSLAALPYALSLAQQDQARLYLLHVIQESDAEPEMGSEIRLRNLLPPTIALACEPKILIQYGQPAQKILEFADELAVDLIVMGVRHPPSYLEATRHLRLATTYAVASQAVCPLLTVRA
jgi:nucleotide-binding universal stress UspA family protein